LCRPPCPVKNVRVVDEHMDWNERVAAHESHSLPTMPHDLCHARPYQSLSAQTGGNIFRI
jgi:hypothetical protein